MDFIKLCDEAHALAVEKGWWKQERSELEIMALIHSEISEAVEECRKGMSPVYWLENSIGEIITGYKDGCKPKGELIELADACIRVFDYVGSIAVSRIEYENKNYNKDYVLSMNAINQLKNIEFYGFLHKTIAINEATFGDCVKIIENWCTDRGWNLEEAIERKMAYNRTRPVRHGGKLH